MHRLLVFPVPQLLLALFTGVMALPDLVRFGPVSAAEGAFVELTRLMAVGGAEAVASPGAHWLGLLALKLGPDLLSEAFWPHRLPSVACAVGAAWMLHAIARLLVGGRAALVASALFAACLAFATAAGTAGGAAPGLLAGLTLLYVLARLHMQGFGKPAMPVWMAHGFWLVLGAAMLAQGLVWPLLVVVLAAALSWRRGGGVGSRMGWLMPLRPFPGVIFLAAMIGPWLASVPDNRLAEALWPGSVPAITADLPFSAWPVWLFAAAAVGRLRAERMAAAEGFLGLWLLTGLMGLLAWPDPSTAVLVWSAPLALATGQALFAVRDGSYALFRHRASAAGMVLWLVATAWLVAVQAAMPGPAAAIAAVAAALAGAYTAVFLWRGHYLNGLAAALVVALILRLAPTA